MKRFLSALILTIAAAGCGDSPASPAPPTAFSLADGAYTLRIFSFSGPGMVCLSLIVGSATPPNASISADAIVSRDGSEWVIRPADAAGGTLLIRLSPSGAGAAGRAVGTVFSQNRTATVALDHVISGTNEGTGASGSFGGDVRFESVPEGAATSCNTTSWSLTRR
jgi:hypothetical protein